MSRSLERNRQSPHHPVGNFADFSWAHINSKNSDDDSPVPVIKKHYYFSIISIVTRLALSKKNFQDTVFDVKFFAGSICYCQNIHMYRCIPQNPHFFVYFQFPGFLLFYTPILSPTLDSTENFTQDIAS